MHAYFENRKDNFIAHSLYGLSFPPHLHPQLELFFTLSGETIVTVRKETRVLKPGGLAVIFPNQIHSYTALTPDSGAVLVICDISRTGAYAETLLRSHPANPFVGPEQLHANVRFAIGEMAAEQNSCNESAVYAPLVQLVLARTLPLLSLHRNQSVDHRELTYQIAQYIGQHFKEPITLEQLAKALGISKFHLSHMFAEKFGQSFPSYLAGIRLTYACSMLTDTVRSVTEIAEESGFESQRTFYRVFRSHYSMSPLEYRKNSQNIRMGVV